MYLSDSASIGEDMERNFNARAQHMSDTERKSAFNANMVSDHPFCWLQCASSQPSISTEHVVDFAFRWLEELYPTMQANSPKSW
jgi:hypothetical protein